jgi:uncharacterized Fe-S cluster protein YjdI
MYGMEKEKMIEYTNSEITIVWKPNSCIHAAVCVNALPKVYSPRARPWLTIENASTEELKKQIGACPSGALSFYDTKDNVKHENKD